MKTLLIARHAKSDWGDASLPDHDRPLNARGRRDAPRVGIALAERGHAPAHVYSSTAARTRETWALMEPHLPGRPRVEWLREMYLAPASRLLDVVRSAPAGADTVMALGHNPGIHGLAAGLSVDGRTSLLGVVGRNMPTGAVAVVELDGDGWEDVAGGRLADLILPRALKRAS